MLTCVRGRGGATRFDFRFDVCLQQYFTVNFRFLCFYCRNNTRYTYMSNSGAGNKNGGIFGESKAPQKFGEMGNKSEEKRNEQKKFAPRRKCWPPSPGLDGSAVYAS